MLQKKLQNNTVGTQNSHLMFIAIAYCVCLILSNTAAMKITSIFGAEIDAGTIFFPITYIFSDVLTEVYGYKQSRRVIWYGLFMNSLFVLGMFAVVHLPHPEYWENQESFAKVFSLSPVIFVASCASYVVGEFLNSVVLAKLKVATHGKYLALRVIGSTILGAAFDTAMFCSIAFYYLPLDILLRMMVSLYLFKLVYEVIALPITYKIILFLKKTDGVDYYDTNTKFNIFSIHVDK